MRVLQKLRQSVNSVVTQKCFKIDKSKIRGDYVDYLPGLKFIIFFFLIKFYVISFNTLDAYLFWV